MDHRVLGDRTLYLRHITIACLTQSARSFSSTEELEISRNDLYCIADDFDCLGSNCVLLCTKLEQVSQQVSFHNEPRRSSSSPNMTNSSMQCTYDAYIISPFWRYYFDDLSFGWNYHTLRCLLSEWIPSLFVAFFNIAIVTCILCRTAQVRRQQQFNHGNHLSMSIGTGSTSKLPASMPIQIVDRPTPTIQRQTSMRNSNQAQAVPLGKMSWMNIILLLHSLLFFLSSSVTSLVFFSTSNIMLAHWVSFIILANCSLNFYVYCLSGRQFRRELKRIGKRYIRLISKKLFRHSRIDHQRRSPIYNGKNNIYQPVHYIKQRPGSTPTPIRPYPGYQ
jgi:hypothetical protein